MEKIEQENLHRRRRKEKEKAKLENPESHRWHFIGGDQKTKKIRRQFTLLIENIFLETKKALAE